MKHTIAIAVVIVKYAIIASAYNTSTSSVNYAKDSNRTREGRFLFDTLFGLELEEELINAASQNTLKSCNCGM